MKQDIDKLDDAIRHSSLAKTGDDLGILNVSQTLIFEER